jgi:lysophospholipase L1-like esterase
MPGMWGFDYAPKVALDFVVGKRALRLLSLRLWRYTRQRGGDKVKKELYSARAAQAAPWVIAAVAVIAFGASFSELQRMRGRFGEVTRHTFHDHQDVREFMIRTSIAGLHQPIIVMGDSITEMARLPDEIGDNPLVNAGIGGATISDFEALAPRLLDDSERPSVIVVALGANDAGSETIQRDYTALLSKLKKLAPRVLAVAVTGIAGADFINRQIKAAADSEGVQFVATGIPQGAMLPDRIHLNAAGYRAWTPALVAAISRPAS